jgi:DNA-binding CsgD family transcriptional regulator
MLVELGRIAAMTGAPDAVEHLNRAVRLLRDPTAQAGALYEVGRALVHAGRYQEAIGAIRQGLGEAGPAPTELRRRLLAALLQSTRLVPGSRDDDDIVGTAEAAVDEIDRQSVRPPAEQSPAEQSPAVRSAPAPGLQALLGELAFEQLLTGEHCDRVRSTAHRALAGLDVPATPADGLPFYNAVAALTWSDDLDVAKSALDRALAQGERQGRLMAVATVSFRRAVVSYLQGSVAAAVTDAQRAVDASAQGWATYLPAARGILALALLEEGQLPRAAVVLEPGGSLDPGGSSPTAAIFLQARATLSLIEGAPDEALADALAAGRLMTEDLCSLSPAIVPWRSLAATAHHRLGAVGEARRLAAEEVDLARHFGAPRVLGAALRVQGLVEGGTRGIDRLREAVEVLADSPARLEYARALADLGTVLGRSGRAESADILRQALERAESCGATALVGRLQEELRATGARCPRRRGRNRAALTPGEQRVAQLAASGLTNKEVAQKQFVSVRAVEFHLGNVYTKLGISSRRQLADALAEA